MAKNNLINGLKREEVIRPRRFKRIYACTIHIEFRNLNHLHLQEQRLNKTSKRN
jgi:hypothetical protein